MNAPLGVLVTAKFILPPIASLHTEVLHTLGQYPSVAYDTLLVIKRLKKKNFQVKELNDLK